MTSLAAKPAISLSRIAIYAVLIFAVLLCGRHIWGWRGKRALRLTLTGFSLLILAYFGSRFVVEVLLGRA